MGMVDVLRRRWRYLTARSQSRFEERADPKVQLEQAITDAQEQHRRLVEQAAAVVANQKQTEMRLHRAMEELEKVGVSTRQALRMAADAQAAGDTHKAAEYNQTAEAFANRLVAVENQANDLKQMSLQSAQASDQARAAVQQNSLVLQQKLAERQKLLSQLDQAKMQEQLNRAMSSLSESVGQDVPSFDQVRDKIEARYARAIGTSELGGQTVESRMLEVQQASLGMEARSRLDAIRAEMGLGTGGGQALGGQVAPGQLGASGGAAPQSGSASPSAEPAASPQTGRDGAGQTEGGQPGPGAAGQPAPGEAAADQAPAGQGAADQAPAGQVGTLHPDDRDDSASEQAGDASHQG